MSTDQATHVRADGGEHDYLPAMPPVTITGTVVEVVDRVIPRRRPTSSVPGAPVTPAPDGQSLPDRFVRRLLIELVRIVLWAVAIPVAVVVNVALAARLCVRAVSARFSARRVSTSRAVTLR